jgi:hypothetical protein
MYGDTTVIRALARSMRQRADDLSGRAESTRWTGVAADAMRRAADDHARGLRLCAAAHEQAADALDRHARAVDRVKELIAHIEHGVLGLLDSAESGLTGLVGHLVPDHLDPVAHWALHFDPPPHGSLAWLDVQVPR